MASLSTDPQDLEQPNETSTLLGDASDHADSDAGGESSVTTTASEQLLLEQKKPWPSTFERSISLLASPIVNAAEAEAYTKSPKAGSMMLAARRNQRMETPEGSLLPPGRSRADPEFKKGVHKIHSLDFKSKPDSVKIDDEYMSSNMLKVQKNQAKKAKEAADYRAKILQQQQSSGGDSPGHSKEKKSLKRLEQMKGKKKQASTSKEGKANFSQCVFNLANILMGVGLLGLPFACASAGWIGGIVAILAFSFIAWRTSILIGRELNGDPRPADFFDDSPYKTPVQPGSVPGARMRRPITSFPDIARAAFGNGGSIVLSIILYFELFSCICIFIVAMADHLHTLFPSVSEVQLTIGVTIASAIPMVMLRTAKLLSYLSMVGTFATISVVMAVFLAAILEGDLTETVAQKLGINSEGPFHTAWKPEGLPLAFGLVAYCFSGHAIVPSIYSSMENPRDFEKVCNVTFIIVTCCCLVVGLSGYWMFGDLVLDQITLSLEQNSSAETAMTILTYLMVLTAYSKTTLTMFPLALGFEEIVAPYLSTDTAVEITSVAIKVVLLFFAVLVSIYVPSFSFLCAMVGMICTISVSVIFPAAAHLKLFSSEIGIFEKAMDWSFVIIGFVVAIIGTALGL